MTSEQRIEKIDEFLNTQRYLHGLQYCVIEDEDNFIIEFVNASSRQLITLNRALQGALMNHIHARAQNIVAFDPPKKKKHGRA
jgi:uncharacterized protein (UPF0179 family)